MKSLFIRQNPKRGRVGLMLGFSLLLHGGVIGIAALWLQPDPEPRTVIIDWGDHDPGDSTSAVPDAPREIAVPVDSFASTPKPSDPVEKEPTPPLPTEEIPMMAEPEQAQPHRAALTKPATATRTTNRAQPAGHPTIGPSGSGNPGGGGAVSSAPAGVWMMPPPPYPRTVLASRDTGATTVRITTDAGGRVSNVVIVKSTGNPILDNQTETYVRTHWHGPPNANRTTEFVYQIK